MRIKTALALVLTVFFTSASFAKSGAAGGALAPDSLDKVQAKIQTTDKTPDTSQDKNQNNYFSGRPFHDHKA